MRLPDEDKKKPDKIRDELLKEFDRGVVNREEAIHLLNTTSIGTSESCSTFSYRLQELVKLAYPDFTAPAMDKISKDYFVKSMSVEMQIALKSVQNYSKGIKGNSWGYREIRSGRGSSKTGVVECFLR